MKRRRKSAAPAGEIRRLALAGRWEELRALLAERLVRDPHDEEARRELERLNQGLPLRATENALTRKRREEQEMQEELAAELALYRNTPALPSEWPPELLARRRKRVAAIRARLGKRLPAEEAELLSAYLAELNSRLTRHHGKRRRRLLLGIGLPLLLAAGTALAADLQQRGKQAEETLRLSMQGNDRSRVELALKQADSPLKRLANKRLAGEIHRARSWLARRERQLSALQSTLAELEAGTRHISTLPLPLRAELEAALQQLPPGMKELSERWERLRAREAQSLARQQEEVLARLNRPLPPLPELSNAPAQDDALLQQARQQLDAHIAEWEAAWQLYRPEQESPFKVLQERRASLLRLRADVAALRRTVALLPSARDYQQYRALLANLAPTDYAPALRMAAVRDHLPEEDKLRDLMQGYSGQLPPGMLEATRRAHLEGGASFTPAFPARARQVQLMEDIFTYRGLHKVLYELSAATLPSVIVEERPEVTDNSVCFTPSTLSPGYSLHTPQRITWHNPQAVYIRRIDATPLLRETGIRRESFFSSANLPTLLDTLLRVEAAECPALARAFIFKRLLAVMAAHECPAMLGLAYAPTLRADARDFARLCRELGMELEPGCWLNTTPESARAEELCARWFREHRHRRYAEEIKRNFGALVQVHPRYVGFIDGEGCPKLFRTLPEGTLLWYVAEGGLAATPLEEHPEEPIPYSPVFVIAKD